MRFAWPRAAHFAVAWSTAFLLVGCGPSAPQGGTDVGNGRNLHIDMRAYEEVSLTGPQSLTLTTGVLLDSLFVAVQEIRLEPAVNGSCSDTSDSSEVDIDGPVVANLVGSGVLGPVPSFGTTSESFCQFRLGFHRVDVAAAPETGAPPEMDGLSIRMVGERSDGTAFVVESELGETFELESTNNVPFGLAPGDHRLFIAYEVGSWITALDLAPLGPGPIVVNKDQNSDRLEAFDDAVKSSARLFRDANDDGSLGATEVMPGSELAN